MLTFSVLWVVLAAAITVMAIMRRSSAQDLEPSETQPHASENVLAVVALFSSLLLLAGFLYVGSSLVSGL